MFIPVIDTVLEMTPVDFEKYALQILESKTKGLDNVKFVHNKVVEAYDGNYQLDGYIEFEVMGVLYKTIVECKHYKYPISREIVQKVYDNLRAIRSTEGNSCINVKFSIRGNCLCEGSWHRINSNG